MHSLADDNVSAHGSTATPSLKRGASFVNSLIDGSPPSAFTSTNFEGHPVQAAQGSWPATQIYEQFSFMEDHGNLRPRLSALFRGSDSYVSSQFGSLPLGSSIWDSKLSFLSAGSSCIAGSSPTDLCNEGSPAPVMNFTAPQSLPSLPANPGFVERAVNLSAFGNTGCSKSSLGGNGIKDRYNGKLNMMKPSRQRSTPSRPNGNKSLGNMRLSAKEAGSAVSMEESCNGTETHTSFLPTANVDEKGGQKHDFTSVNESNECIGRDVSSCCGPASIQGLSERNGRKRKAGLQKVNDDGDFGSNLKDMDPDDDRTKCLVRSENAFHKRLESQEQIHCGNSEELIPQSAKEASKPPEPPKPDFIHVRARRGQATDSHSLAERVRREKISERMKFLQDLVPGCSKVSGKAVMLDEIINYVQSLQRQVEFLSMKLAAVNPRVEFSIENLSARERQVQPNVVTPASAFGTQTPNLFPSLHSHQQPHVQMQSLDQWPSLKVHTIGSDPVFRQAIGTPSVTETYEESTSQVAKAWNDELQSVV